MSELETYIKFGGKPRLVTVEYSGGRDGAPTFNYPGEGEAADIDAVILAGEQEFGLPEGYSAGDDIQDRLDRAAYRRLQDLADY